MKCRRLALLRRSGVLALIALPGSLMGCTDAVVDAGAAGALNFIQNSMTSMLTNTVFPSGSMAVDTNTLGQAMDQGDGDHQGHGD